MFLVNRMFGNSAPAPELSVLEGGQLFLVRPNSVKGARECIFIEAALSLRRTTHEFNYQLVVTRTFQEGEEQLLEDDAENSDERAFLIDSSLFLSLGPTSDPSAPDPRPLSFAWLDPEGDLDDEYEFILSPDTPAQQASDFEKLILRSMWEKDNLISWPTDRPSVAIAEKQLETEYKCERVAAATPAKATTSKSVPLFRPVSPDSSDDERPPPRRAPVAADESDGDRSDNDSGDELAAVLLRKAVITPAAAPRPAKSAPNAVASSSKAAARVDPVVAEKPGVDPAPQEISTAALVSVRGELHLFDRRSGMFMLQELDTSLAIHQVDGGHWLMVQGEGGIWVSQGISIEMCLNFSVPTLAMTFNFDYSKDESEPIQTYTWLVRFADIDTFDRVQAVASAAQFELKYGPGSWAKLKEDDRVYNKSAYVDVEMQDIEEEQEEEDEEEDEDEEPQEDDEDGGDSEDSNSEAVQRSFKTAKSVKRTKNSQLAVGYKDAMSFVVAGDMIGVFRQSRDGAKKLDFVTNMKDLRTPDGQMLAPSKVMLHNQDTSMILQNPNDKGALYRLDLETGKVVEEYNVSDNFDVSSFIPGSKYAQTTQEQTFIGLSHNGVFRIDPRLSGNKLVDSQFKQYVTKNDFSVAATTESGKLAVASNKGDIRLFDALGKNAKTALPALGDPILGIDVTADGRYVIATCKTYLLLIDTLIPEGAGRYAGSSGFDRSLPAAQKPTPRRLQLKPEHVAQMNQDNKTGVSFTPAKFNSGIGDAEKTIVTSTGPYIVAWNFKHVKTGRLTDYTIRRFSDTVIADNFKFGQDREIIVTLPDNVFVQDKKKLAPASRESMSVVKTWDSQ